MSQKLVTSIDSTSIFIGEEINYKLELYSDSLLEIKFPESESFVPMEVLKTYDTDTIISNNKYIVSKKYALTNFDAASYILPKQKVVFGDTTLFSDSKKKSEMLHTHLGERRVRGPAEPLVRPLLRLQRREGGRVRRARLAQL